MGVVLRGAPMRHRPATHHQRPRRDPWATLRTAYHRLITDPWAITQPSWAAHRRLMHGCPMVHYPNLMGYPWMAASLPTALLGYASSSRVAHGSLMSRKRIVLDNP